MSEVPPANLPDPISTDNVALESEISEANSADTPDATKSKRNTLLAASIVAILALPFGYLALHYSHTPVAPITTPAGPSNSELVATLEQAVRTQPTPENRLNLSMAYLNDNRPSNAIPLLQALIAESPGNAKAWNNLCVAHNMKSEYNNSVEECRHAINLDPSFQLAKNNLQWAENQIQKALDAIATAENTPAASRTPESYLNEGLNYLHVGNYDQALQVWKQMAASDPRNALVANDIGVAYMSKHQPADAIPWFNKASALDPTLEIAKNNLAWAQSEQTSAARK